MSWGIADYYLLKRLRTLEATVAFLASQTATVITGQGGETMSGDVDPRTSGEKPANVHKPAMYQLYSVNQDGSKSPFLLLWWSVEEQIWL